MTDNKNISLTRELPAPALLTIHMDNDSPRGMDAMFQSEAFMHAAGSNSGVLSRASYTKDFGTKLYNIDRVIEIGQGLLKELLDGKKYSCVYSNSTKTLIAVKYEAGSSDFIELQFSIRYDYRASLVFVNAYGLAKYVDRIEHVFENDLERDDVRSYDIELVKMIDEKGNAATTTITVPAERMNTPHIEFYPCLQELGYTSVEEFEKDYMSSNKALLMMIGLPGTGKTTLLSWIAMRAKQKHRYLIQQDMPLASAGFGGFILDMQGDCLLGIEDSHNSILLSRDRDNPQMSALLNFCDGAGSLSNKLMVSTNLESMSEVDTALPRKGRKWRVIRFDKLTPEQANIARAKIGLPAWNFNKPVTLADALYAEDTDDNVGITARQEFGFANA